MTQARQYDRPIKIADGIFWVGFNDLGLGNHEPGYALSANPYLVMGEGGEAVVIDGGSRPDFAVVMTKILQTGQSPDLIKFLIYQHYDPDLCGSLPNFIDMCSKGSPAVVSHPANIVFLRYYTGPKYQRHFVSIYENNKNLILAGGRSLRFIETPYCHTTGSFVTYDEQTKTLFTSDLFGSFARDWQLYLDLNDDCFECCELNACPKGRDTCPLIGIIAFHRHVMPSGKALAHAMGIIRALDIDLVAPQHGSLISNRVHIYALIDLLEKLDQVGIDHIC